MFILYIRDFWDSHSCTKILKSSPGSGSSQSTTAFSGKTICSSGFQQSVVLVNHQSWKVCRCGDWVKLMPMFLSLMSLFVCSLKLEFALMGSQYWIPEIAEGLNLINQDEQWLFAVAMVNPHTHSSCVLDTISWTLLCHNIALRKVSFTQLHHHHNLQQRLYKLLPLILWIKSQSDMKCVLK